MELAPDDDMKGLLGIEPANAEEVRLPPALRGGAAPAGRRGAGAQRRDGTRDGERRATAGHAEDFDDAATMSCSATAVLVPASAPEWSTATGSAAGALHRHRCWCSPTGSVTASDW